MRIALVDPRSGDRHQPSAVLDRLPAPLQDTCRGSAVLCRSWPWLWPVVRYWRRP